MNYNQIYKSKENAMDYSDNKAKSTPVAMVAPELKHNTDEMEITKACAVLGCDDSKNLDPEMFFRFPEDPSLRQIWTDLTGRNNWTPTDYSYMCMQHFSVDCFMCDDQDQMVLVDKAVPSQKLPRHVLEVEYIDEETLDNEDEEYMDTDDDYGNDDDNGAEDENHGEEFVNYEEMDTEMNYTETDYLEKDYKEVDHKGVTLKELTAQEMVRKVMIRKEQARKEMERKEMERKEAERMIRKELEQKEKMRQEMERKELEHIEMVRKERERRERQLEEIVRMETELKERARKEAENKEMARREAERKEMERKELERKETERKEMEMARKAKSRIGTDRNEISHIEVYSKEKDHKPLNGNIQGTHSLAQNHTDVENTELLKLFSEVQRMQRQYVGLKDKLKYNMRLHNKQSRFLQRIREMTEIKKKILNQKRKKKCKILLSLQDKIKEDATGLVLAMPMRQTDDLKNFALNVYKYSPQAYIYIRNMLRTMLPSTEILNSWLSSGYKPKTVSASGNTIKIVAEQSETELSCKVTLG